ncbi:hypothetical protein [Rugosimonospora africana]|uniref:DUF2567 domain-containing protein n=1 Tax=Rugosimonospora africana TaxID=556532 RepID=A0A8J3VUA8_9ACTN|nr:hypothetical protein [Rugosimonospora africana]GIH19075.1 hypothetical protein Raf01_72470 [Rugosimonospora africana]
MSTPIPDPDGTGSDAAEDGPGEPGDRPAGVGPASTTPSPAIGGWHVPDAGADVPEPAALAVPIIPEGPAEPERTSRLSEILLAVGVAALITALGFPLGWLWSAAAPWIPAEKVPRAAVLAQPEQEQIIADEGWYLLITVVAGLVLALLAWILLRRHRGVFMVLGLAVGGVLGGVLTLKFGHHIGTHHFKNLVANAPVGTQFPAPVNLRVQQIGLWHHWLPYARGDVLALAITATALYVLLAGFSAHPSLRGPDPQQPGVPVYDLPIDGYPGPGTEPRAMEAGTGPSIGGATGPTGPVVLSSDS